MGPTLHHSIKRLRSRERARPGRRGSCGARPCQAEAEAGSLLQKGTDNVFTSGSGFSKEIGWGMSAQLQRSVPGGSFHSYSVYWGGRLGWSLSEVSSCGIWSPSWSGWLGEFGDQGAFLQLGNCGQRIKIIELSYGV